MKKTQAIGILLALALGLALCACGPGPSSLFITLPDQEARDQTVRILVSVIEPSQGASCQSLLEMEARPGDAGYAVVKSMAFDYPVTGDIDGLSDVGSGQRLFYAEAENVDGAVFLNGCSVKDAGDDVIIALQ